jgi:hypothetical protein
VTDGTGTANALIAGGRTWSITWNLVSTDYNNSLSVAVRDYSLVKAGDPQPTPLPVNATAKPASAALAVAGNVQLQSVALSGNLGVSFNGSSTVYFSVSATPAAIQTALAALPGLGGGVSVTSISSSTFQAQWSVAFPSTPGDLPLLTVDASLVAGAPPTSVVETTAGGLMYGPIRGEWLYAPVPAAVPQVVVTSGGIRSVCALPLNEGTGLLAPGCAFTYSQQATPTLTSATPQAARVGSVMTLNGTALACSAAAPTSSLQPTILYRGLACRPSSVTATGIVCTMSLPATSDEQLLPIPGMEWQITTPCYGSASVNLTTDVVLLQSGLTDPGYILNSTTIGGGRLTLQGYGLPPAPNVAALSASISVGAVGLNATALESTYDHVILFIPPAPSGAPIGVVGSVVISFIDANGEVVSLSWPFEFVEPPIGSIPYVAAVSPASGSAAGGDAIVVDLNGMASMPASVWRTGSPIAISIGPSLCLHPTLLRPPNATGDGVQIECVTTPAPVMAPKAFYSVLATFISPTVVGIPILSSVQFQEDFEFQGLSSTPLTASSNVSQLSDGDISDGSGPSLRRLLGDGLSLSIDDVPARVLSAGGLGTARVLSRAIAGGETRYGTSSFDVVAMEATSHMESSLRELEVLQTTFEARELQLYGYPSPGSGAGSLAGGRILRLSGAGFGSPLGVFVSFTLKGPGCPDSSPIFGSIVAASPGALYVQQPSMLGFPATCGENSRSGICFCELTCSRRCSIGAFVGARLERRLWPFAPWRLDPRRPGHAILSLRVCSRGACAGAKRERGVGGAESRTCRGRWQWVDVCGRQWNAS